MILANLGLFWIRFYLTPPPLTVILTAPEYQ